MTEHSINRDIHIEEGDLVRYLDDEVTAAQRAQFAAHLLACRRCAGELDSLRAERVQFSALLADLPVQPMDPDRRTGSLRTIQRAASRNAPARRSSGGMLRAAAVATILVASALATSPVRAWVGDLWTGLTEQVERLVADRAADDGAVGIAMNDATIGFVPAGDEFVLEIASTQESGSLILAISEEASVMARATGSAESIDLVVLPSGMRIRNHPDATADYAISLPSTLRQVRVRIGDEPPTVYEVADLGESWISTIDLAAGSGGR